MTLRALRNPRLSEPPRLGNPDEKLRQSFWKGLHGAGEASSWGFGPAPPSILMRSGQPGARARGIPLRCQTSVVDSSGRFQPH